MEEAVQMNTDIRNLKAKLKEQRKENERMKSELTKKDNGIKELRTQLGLVKTETQVQAQHLQRRKEVMQEANKKIAHLMEQLREQPQKAVLHVKKIIEKFHKKMEEDVEISTATALQQWCVQATELQVLRVDKANRDIEGPGF